MTYKHWGILLVILFSVQVLFACDICGCGVGGNYTGLLPEFNKKISGIRYYNKKLVTHLSPDGSRSYLTEDERYQTAEWWTVIGLGNKVRLSAAIPYHFNDQMGYKGKTSIRGLGDINLIGFYKITEKRQKNHSGKIMIHQLWGGGGLKLKTGKYDKPNNLFNDPAIFQLGTGSTDFYTGAMYDFRVQDFGISINCQYKMNTVNSIGYRYGNKLTNVIQLYHKYRFKNQMSITPNYGFMYEQSAKDVIYNNKTDQSGGKLFNGSLGIELVYKKVSTGINYQFSLIQNIANGFIKSNSRAMFHFSTLL